MDNIKCAEFRNILFQLLKMSVIKSVLNIIQENCISVKKSHEISFELEGIQMSFM